MESNFDKKIANLKKTLLSKETEIENNNKASNCKNRSQTCKIEVSGNCKPKQPREQLIIQQPILIQRKNSRAQLNKGSVSNKFDKKKCSKKIEEFIPINIPAKQKRMSSDFLPPNQQPNNKHIQIQIQKDNSKDQQCLKKLFKKIHKLTDQLTEHQKQNMRLKLQLQQYRNTSKICNEHQRVITRLQGEKYKLEVELEMLKRLLHQKDHQIKMLMAKTPKETIKEVVVEKPVEVKIQVPKIVPGPERIVEKLVEVPKYIEVEKMVQVPDVVPPKEIQKPVYIDRPIQVPVYIDRPIEKIVDRPVQVPVQKIVEVPIEVPVYINRQNHEDELLIAQIRKLECEMEQVLQCNDFLCKQNHDLKANLEILTRNLDILSRHNHEKNRVTENLMHKSFEHPISPTPYIDLSTGSMPYTVSSCAHRRVI